MGRMETERGPNNLLLFVCCFHAEDAPSPVRDTGLLQCNKTNDLKGCR
jgi:hypothetical protein